jgi:hypothetical protein
VLVGVWTASTALGGIAVWSAVAQLGDEATATDHTQLSQAEVRAELASSQATATTSSSGTTSSPTSDQPSTSGPTSSGQPSTDEPSTGQPPASGGAKRQTGAWTLAGGTVGVACQGSVISLLYATPVDGWSMERETGPDQVEVKFRRDESESELRVECSGGEPVGEVKSDGGGSDD